MFSAQPRQKNNWSCGGVEFSKQGSGPSYTQSAKFGCWANLYPLDALVTPAWQKDYYDVRFIDKCEFSFSHSISFQLQKPWDFYQQLLITLSTWAEKVNCVSSFTPVVWIFWLLRLYLFSTIGHNLIRRCGFYLQVNHNGFSFFFVNLYAICCTLFVKGISYCL